MAQKIYKPFPGGKRQTLAGVYRMKRPRIEVLNKLLDWHADDPRTKPRSLPVRRNEMQRQFTIELRVDYADAEKNETMRTALQAAARHVYATAVLLADQVKPQIAIFSDDFFSGHEQIALLEDTIAKGKAQIDSGAKEEAVSDELLDALRSQTAEAAEK